MSLQKSLRILPKEMATNNVGSPWLQDTKISLQQLPFYILLKIIWKNENVKINAIYDHTHIHTHKTHKTPRYNSLQKCTETV